MKYIFFGLAGFLVGFLLIGGTVPRVMALASGSAGSAPRAGAPTSVGAGDPQTASGTDILTGIAAPSPASPATAAPPRPARERAGAFMLSFLASGGFPGETSAIATNPETGPLYRRVIAAEARPRLAGLKVALGLSDSQFDQFIDAAIDQKIANMRGYEAMVANPTAPRNFRDEISRDMEARLSTFMTPEQIEDLTAIGLGSNVLSETLERYAAIGIVLRPEVLRENLVSGQPIKIPAGTFATKQVNIGVDSAGLTDEQRAKLQTRAAIAAPLQQASRLSSRLRSTIVRDPEVFDIWPW